MGYKIKIRTIEGWLTKGDTRMLAAHWLSPEVQSYRKSQLARKDFYKDPLFNDWCAQRNGSTLAYLLGNDPEVRKGWHDLHPTSKWSEAFFKYCWSSFWPLLDVGPQALRTASGPEVLDLLIRENHVQSSDYVYADETRAKLHDDVLGFYRRFQKQGALIAIAGCDNSTLWNKQTAMMANLIRHAAMHEPSDVLGAYIVWACDAVHPTLREHNAKEGEHAHTDFNAAQMKRLLLLAQRCGLDTSSYQEHAQQCKKLHDGLGLPMNGANVLVYAQSVNAPAAPLLNSEDMGFLFS